MEEVVTEHALRTVVTRSGQAWTRAAASPKATDRVRETLG
jgi:hypothetical protein